MAASTPVITSFPLPSLLINLYSYIHTYIPTGAFLMISRVYSPSLWFIHHSLITLNQNIVYHHHRHLFQHHHHHFGEITIVLRHRS